MSIETDINIQKKFFQNNLDSIDPEITKALQNEYERQSNQIELIASENIASLAVIQAQGSLMTNKYAEGYPGKRYYGGCEYYDTVENLAIDRAKEIFDCKCSFFLFLLHNNPNPIKDDAITNSAI